MNKTHLSILIALVLLVGCNVGPLTSGPDQQTFLETNDLGISTTPAELCDHNLSSFRGDVGAEVTDTPEGTIYECTSDAVHECTNGEGIIVTHYVANTEGEAYTVELKPSHEFTLDETGSLVEINEPVGLKMQVPGSDNWYNVDEAGVYNVTALKTTGNGSASVTTSSQIIVEDGSGGNSNG